MYLKGPSANPPVRRVDPLEGMFVEVVEVAGRVARARSLVGTETVTTRNHERPNVAKGSRVLQMMKAVATRTTMLS